MSEGPALGAKEIIPPDAALLVMRRLQETFPGVRFQLRIDQAGDVHTLAVGWEAGPELAAVEALVEAYQGRERLGSPRFAWLLPDGTARVAHVVGGGAEGTFLPPAPEARLVRFALDRINCTRADASRAAGATI